MAARTALSCPQRSDPKLPRSPAGANTGTASTIEGSDVTHSLDEFLGRAQHIDSGTRHHREIEFSLEALPLYDFCFTIVYLAIASAL